MKILLSLFLFLMLFSVSRADTLRLKNGRSIEGIIKKENGNTVELEVGPACSVSFLNAEIESIIRSQGDEDQSLRQKWEEQKLARKEKLARLKLEEGAQPSSVSFSPGLQGIVVNVTLNNKVSAKMVLDTGASTMIITRKIADELKLNLNKVEPDIKAQVADGRQVLAKRVVLESVEAQGAEAKDVEAAVLLEEERSLGFGDGLLGMSFLKRFNFKVDQKNKKLILEKL